MEEKRWPRTRKADVMRRTRLPSVKHRWRRLLLMRRLRSKGASTPCGYRRSSIRISSVLRMLPESAQRWSAWCAAGSREALLAEVLRRSALRSFHRAFVKRCKQGKRAIVEDRRGGPLSCLVKWHFAVLHRSRSDPLLPHELSGTDQEAIEVFLASELQQLGYGSLAADSIAAWTWRRFSQEGKALRFRLQQLHQQEARRAGKRAIGQLDIVARPSKQRKSLIELSHDHVVLHLNQAHLEKLEGLYSEKNLKEKGAHQPEEHRRSVLQAIFTLLLRYQSVSGPGFQCALPVGVFNCLKTLWGVDCEGFASPLNCHFGAGRYCSVFPDTDRPFGSLGSFFDQKIKRGALELNPPFSFELYTAIGRRCAALLAAADLADEPLIFVVIIGLTPVAMEHLSVKEGLECSPFLRGKLHIGVADHSYIDGRQHHSELGVTFRACDTCVYFLQSAAAAARWPVTPSKLELLRKAFYATRKE